METWDVVVVGAGLAGCAVAWHVAPSARVLVLDGADQPGAEATAQNAGMVRRLGEDPFERALATRTHAWLLDPGEDWAAAAPSRRTGAFLGLARDRYHLHDGAAHLRARGAVVEACDRPAEVAQALRGSPVPFGWWLPDERVADPAAMLAGFLRGARRSRAEVRCGVSVRGLLREGARVVGVDTDRGPVAAGRVVVAAGAWSGVLAARAGLRRPLVPVRRSVFWTAPHAASHPDHPWVWIDDVGIYVRPEGEGWLGSPCDEAIDPPQGFGSKGPLGSEAAASAHEKLSRWLPALADARIAGGWTGLRTFAPDRRPVLGADPDAPGLWWAAGLGGFGVTCAFGVGEAVSTWLLGGTLPWIRPEPVSPGRPWPGGWHVRPTGDLDDTRWEVAS